MTKHIVRSVSAVLAGLVAGAVLTIDTDTALEHAGVLPLGPHHITWLHVLEVTYRTLYAILGGYLAARLASIHPVRHAMAVGAISLAMNLFGAAATWHMNLAPVWFTATLVILALPAAWAGGLLRTARAL